MFHYSWLHQLFGTNCYKFWNFWNQFLNQRWLEIGCDWSFYTMEIGKHCKLRFLLLFSGGHTTVFNWCQIQSTQHPSCVSQRSFDPLKPWGSSHRIPADLNSLPQCCLSQYPLQLHNVNSLRISTTDRGPTTCLRISTMDRSPTPHPRISTTDRPAPRPRISTMDRGHTEFAGVPVSGCARWGPWPESTLSFPVLTWAWH